MSSRASRPRGCSSPSGTLAYRQDRGKEKEAIAAATGDGAITLPVLVLTDNGTAGAAEVFAGALQGNKRAQIVGERTRGRAAHQKLVKLPDGSGLLLTHMLYLRPGGGAIHEKGLVPDLAVEQPTWISDRRRRPTTRSSRRRIEGVAREEGGLRFRLYTWGSVASHA